MPAKIAPTPLVGLTWNDPRGLDPVVAAAAAFAAENPGFQLRWESQPLQGFESAPLDDLAARYDLIVIDHPHVGMAAGGGVLLPLDRFAAPQDLARIEGETVGKSFASYRWGGHQWALPIDAAAQVQAIRPDLQPGPLHRWADVLRAADDGAVLWPLRPPHVLMSFFTLCANIGAPCAVTPGALVAPQAGQRVLAAMTALAQKLDPACRAMDPIAALNALAESRHHRLIPLTYLYAPYARPGHRAARIAFHDMPALGAMGPIGSALGGTGIAVSARSQHPELCTRFAVWLASAPVQAGLYAAHNGQPGNAQAWGDGAVNDPVGGAYFATRITHEAAWLRPRHDGYMAFQEEASQIVLEAITGALPHDAALAALDARFNKSFAP